MSGGNNSFKSILNDMDLRNSSWQFYLHSKFVSEIWWKEVAKGIFPVVLRTQSRRQQKGTCCIAKPCCTRMDRKTTDTLLSIHQMNTDRLIAILTGHCPFGRHVERLCFPINDCCSIRGSLQEEETVFHLMWQCLFLSRRNYRFWPLIIWHCWHFAKWGWDQFTENANFGKKKSSFQMKLILILAGM